MEALVPVAASFVGSLFTSSNNADAARDASGRQVARDEASIAEARAARDNVTKLLAPWVTTGNAANAGQADIAGLNGNPAQDFALSQIRTSPMFTSMKKTGEDAILQNASATGGLRGGNVQAGLAQFDETLLSKLIDQQYGRLTGLSNTGENAAAGTGAAGTNAAVQIGNLNSDAGAAEAGGILGVARANNQAINGLVNGAGVIAGRFGSTPAAPTPGGYTSPFYPTYASTGGRA